MLHKDEYKTRKRRKEEKKREREVMNLKILGSRKSGFNMQRGRTKARKRR